ncbi:SatD family protein [Natronospora cellulosivora (SeqCode)]
MTYCAITGDIDNSRNYEDRSKLIKKIKKTVNYINDNYQKVLAAKFIIYSGDEVQGLLQDPSDSYRLIRELQRMMYPVKLQFGVGIGELSTPVPVELDTAYTGELDGEAYYRAREMLNLAKKYNQNVFYYFDDRACDLINNLIAFIDSTEDLRTEKQWETVRLYEKYKKQKLVAEELNINQTTVSRSLNRSSYYLIKKTEKSIGEYLSKI